MSQPVESILLKIDTKRRREVVRRLTDALFEFLTLETDEMEEAEAEKPKAPTPEMLISVQQGIDALESQIEKAKASLVEVPGMIRGAMETALVSPLEERLEQTRAYLSHLQKLMEEAADV